MCWICEGWVEQSFEIKMANNSREIYIHIDFDGFRPLVVEGSSVNRYTVKKMCPPKRKIYYFYSTPNYEGFYDFRSPSVSYEKVLLDLNLENITFETDSQ